MSEINVSYTIPPELLGGKSVKQADHGPFYFISPAVPVHRVDYKDSVPHIHPCVVTICTDWVEKLPEQLCPVGSAVQWEDAVDQVGSKTKVATTVVPAFAIRDVILNMHESWGVKEIEAFAHKTRDEIGLELFNSTVYPISIEPGKPLTDEFAKVVEQKGGLAVRQSSFELGRTVVEGAEFVKKFGKERQTLYLTAIAECLAAFVKARDYVTRELNESDADIRLRLSTAGGKPTYDPRDVYFQWLLARRPVNEGQPAQPINITLPDGFGQQAGLGLSKDDLIALVQAAAESAVAKQSAPKVE